MDNKILEIFIPGPAGRLEAKYYKNPKIICVLRDPRDIAISGAHYFEIHKYDFLRKIFSSFYLKNKPIEAVIHFAGLKSVSDSVNKPLDYWDVNVSGTISLLEIMCEFNCFSLVFSSSATIYKPLKSEKLNVSR